MWMFLSRHLLAGFQDLGREAWQEIRSTVLAVSMEYVVAFDDVTGVAEVADKLSHESLHANARNFLLRELGSSDT
jgi:hypothetical protein